MPTTLGRSIVHSIGLPTERNHFGSCRHTAGGSHGVSDPLVVPPKWLEGGDTAAEHHGTNAGRV
jgi:hypothetical protein